jgi:hypothetical protein
VVTGQWQPQRNNAAEHHGWFRLQDSGLPEVNLLILMTTSAGYYLASGGHFSVIGLVNTLVGTVLVASGTATLNQWMERGFDGQMRRTANRPLPSGTLNAHEALLFGNFVERRRRVVSCACSQPAIRPSRSIVGAFLSSGLHSAEAENAAVHASGRFPWCYADSDRLGGSLRAHRQANLVSFRHSFSLAVSPLPGYRLDVP